MRGSLLFHCAVTVIQIKLMQQFSHVSHSAYFLIHAQRFLFA